MKALLISGYLVELLCGFIGFFYGLKRFKNAKALYGQMATWGVGCIALGRLLIMVKAITQGVPFKGMFTPLCGFCAGALFFFAANYGGMDKLVDDRSKQIKKYRIFALIIPLILLVTYVAVAYYFQNINFCIDLGIVIFTGSFACYYSCKHIIIPDVENGIVKSLRPYNMMVILVVLLFVFELIIENLPINTVVFTLLFIKHIVGGVLLVSIIPVLERSMKKWII